jgi:DnaJ-domain-containing protein 1
MASAAAVGMVGGNGCAGSSASWFQIKNRRKKNSNDKMGRDGVRFFTAASYSSPSVMDPYKTLRIQPDASESEVKKAFRQLALQV